MSLRPKARTRLLTAGAAFVAAAALVATSPASGSATAAPDHAGRNTRPRATPLVRFSIDQHSAMAG